MTRLLCILLLVLCSTSHATRVWLFMNDGGTTTTPPPPVVTLDSVAISGAASITEGNNEQYTLTGTYSDASTSNFTSAATWAETVSLSNVTLSASGLVTVTERETTNDYTFTATYDGLADTNTVSIIGTNVVSEPVASLTGDYPDLAVTEPTNSYPVAFAAFDPPVSTNDPAASTPVIYEYTRVADAGDTIAITGGSL